MYIYVQQVKQIMITTTNITVDGDGVDDEKDIKAKKKCDGSLLFDDPRVTFDVCVCMCVYHLLFSVFFPFSVTIFFIFFLGDILKNMIWQEDSWKDKKGAVKIKMRTVKIVCQFRWWWWW